MSFQVHTPGVRTYLDGREVCDKSAAGVREYKARKDAMYERQEMLCAICREWLSRAYCQFDHQCSRGGGKQDDRIEVNGQWQNAAVHDSCNNLKGSRRYHWKDGLYIPIYTPKQ